ncbi:MAG: hypothetical protein ABL308_03235 [Oceanicaulis sp.]
MSDASHIRETDRRAHDGGRAARAWRWFSGRTMRAAERYRDISWRIVGLNALGAAGLIALSRLDPGHGLAPWALIAGGIWALIALRMIGFKLFDAAVRR